jgi:transcriptional regulator with XRE-family HTH domain
MLSADIPQRLKALREAAGMSIRALASELRMSSSGYAHYETSARFKDDYLPMQMARDIARVLSSRGVSSDQIMELAGGGGIPRPSSNEPKGFAEDAARPWVPPSAQRDSIEAAIRALAPDPIKPGTYQMSFSIPELGLVKGDIIIVDLKRLPISGDLALANAQTDDGGMTTVIGRYLPPLLFTADSLKNGTILDVSTGQIAVYQDISRGLTRPHDWRLLLADLGSPI